MRVGLDIGSTTIKCVVLDEQDTLLYSTYERHYSHILEKAQELLRRIDAEQLHCTTRYSAHFCSQQRTLAAEKISTKKSGKFTKCLTFGAENTIFFV